MEKRLKFNKQSSEHSNLDYRVSKEYKTDAVRLFRMKQYPEIENIAAFLQKKEGYSIQIYDTSTGENIQTKLNQEDLVKKNTDLISYIYGLGDVYPNLDTIGIQKFRPNGNNSDMRYQFPLIVKMPIKEMENQIANTNQSTMRHANQQITPVVSEAPHYPSQNGFTSPAGLMGAMGMSIPELVSLHTKAERYLDMKELNQELKGKNQKLEHRIEQLTIENGKQAASIELAGQKLDLELSKKEYEKRPAIDPKTMDKGMDMLTQILPSILAGKNPETPGLAGSENGQTALSEDKQGLISLVNSENFTDELALNLGLVAEGFMQDKEFSDSLHAL